MFGLAWRAWGRDQQDLVDRLKENEILHSPNVELSFRLVDRALFVPMTALERAQREAERAAANEASTSGGGGETGTAPARPATARDQQAYIDGPIKVGPVHISAPHMYALVLEKLGLEKGMSFLNVGSGSGYMNCMASVLVGRGGVSHGVERVDEVVTHARHCARKWRRNMERMRQEQRHAAVTEAVKRMEAEQTSVSKKEDLSEMKDVEEATPAAAPVRITTVATAASGRASPMSISQEHLTDDDMEEDAEGAYSSAPASTVQSAGSAALPRPFQTIELSHVPGGPPRRGVLGPALDLINPNDPGGDGEASAALQRSILPLESVFRRHLVPQPSPSPTLSNASGDSDSTASSEASLGAWRPSTPVPKIHEPQFIVGDAFDLDPSVCGLYDRIYIGASTPERFIPFFLALLHPGGRLIGPFGSAMIVVYKRRDGAIVKEKVSDVSYAPIVLKEESDTSTAPPAPIRFTSRVFTPPFGFSCLPRAMQAAIDCLLMLQRRDGATCLPGRLPMVLWMHIMSFLPVDAYMDRAQGDVPWMPDVAALLSRARVQLAAAESVLDSSPAEAADSTRLEEAESILTESLAHTEQVRDWLEIRLPTTTTIADESPDFVVGDAPLSVSVSGVDTQLSVLRDLVEDPTRLASRRYETTPDQVVQLYWRIHTLLLRVLTHHKHSAAMRVANRLLALRPNHCSAWRLLARNAYLDHQLPEAMRAVDRATQVLDSSVDDPAERASLSELRALITARMPAFRRSQQQMSARLMAMIMQGIIGHAPDEDEADQDVEEGEGEDEEAADEDEPDAAADEP